MQTGDEGTSSQLGSPIRSPGHRTSAVFRNRVAVSTGIAAMCRRPANAKRQRSITGHITSSPRTPKTVTYSDRFIPSRAAGARLNFSLLEREKAADETPQRDDKEDPNPAYNMLLRSELLGCASPPLASPPQTTAGAAAAVIGSPSRNARRVLSFKAGDAGPGGLAGAPTTSPFAKSPVGNDNPFGPNIISPKRAQRKIARTSFKVLDAPALADDFYLNLVDWSAQNMLAVGLGNCVYLWSACNSKVTKLHDFGSSDSVCSVSWSQRGSFLAIGTNKGEAQIWDPVKCKRIRSMSGHRNRVGTMSWNSHLLSTGSRDRAILQRDVRAPEQYVQRMLGHRSEVCGLKWSPDDRELASGGNDNQLFIWGTETPAAKMRFAEHNAAVKAIAWSPHQHGLLASGGGTADRCIRFWNTLTQTPLQHIDTGSQVCNLSWSKNVNEIVSTHGYSQNQIVVWKYPSMSKLATLTGHTLRVLYLAVSPDGQTIVTGAGDETLRFWNVFPGPKSQGSVHDSTVATMLRTQIR